MRRLTAAVLLIGLSLVLPGCGNQTKSSSSTSIRYPYKIETTCGMVTDIVTIVAGDKAEVQGLIGPGVDPHLFRPKRSHVKRLMAADVILYSGLMLEGRMSDTFLQVQRGNRDKRVYAVTEEIDQKFLREPPEFEGHWDPHVWMDAQAWSECVAFVAKALSEYDASNKDYYEKNAATYRQELAKLDDYARQAIGSIPQEQRVLITAHDAFGYFARAYNIEVKSVQGLSTESETDLKNVNDLVDFISKRKIKAIFVESSVSEENIKALVEGSEKQGWKVQIGGVLYSDAMGEPGTYEGTYVGMIDHNATTIARALGGEAPEKGMNGKLK